MATHPVPPSEPDTPRRFPGLDELAPDLSPVEADLVAAFATGTWFDAGGPPAGRAAAEDPDGAGHPPGPDPAPDTIRADVLRALLTGPAGDNAALRLRGARIVGQLDLRESRVRPAVSLRDCRIMEGMLLAEAQFEATVTVTDSRLRSVHAVMAYFGRGLTLVRCRLVSANLSLAHFGQDLQILGTFAHSPGPGTLTIVGATVDGSIYLLSSYQNAAVFTTEVIGGIYLGETHVGRNVEFEGLVLSHPSAVCLDLARLKVAGNVELTYSVNPTTGDALLDDDGRLSTPLRTDGEVRLTGAEIGGNLSFTAVVLGQTNGVSVVADELTVGGSIVFLPACDDHGEPLRDQSGVLRGPEVLAGKALLRGARVHGIMQLPAAVVGDPSGDHRFNGTVDLTRASVGTLTWSSQVRLDELRQLPPSPGEWLRFLFDIPVVAANGLTYDDLHSAASRSTWLALRFLRLGMGGHHQPQPFEELAAYYARQGYPDRARRVRLASRRRLARTRPRWKRWMWPADLLQDILTGYGYAPGRAALWLGTALLTGVWFFQRRPPVAVPGSVPRTFQCWLYVIDLVLPGSPLGLEASWAAYGAGYWLGLGLQLLGWALTLAVFPAVTRALGHH